MGNCCKTGSYGLGSSKKRTKTVTYQMPGPLIDFHQFDQFAGPSLSSQGVSPSPGSEALKVNDEAEASPACEKLSESGDSEPELPTAALPMPYKRPSSVPFLNLSQLRSPPPEPPKICIQESWTDPASPLSKQREDNPSLTFSSSSGVDPGPAGSGSVQSKLDISAFGVSSDTKSLQVDTSPIDSGSLPAKSGQKLGFEAVEQPQPSLFTAEDGVVPDSESVNIKITIPRLSHPSEASTQTFRPVVTTRVKCTQRLEVAKDENQTRLNDYVVLREIRTEEKRGSWYLVRLSTTLFLIWEYSKSDQSLQTRFLRDSIHTQISILDRITHPGVLQLLEVIDCPEEDAGYLVFENAIGFVQPTALPEPKAKKAFVALVATVQYLHEVAQVVHLGIRVEALLWSADGGVKLTDFTSAQSIKDSEDTYRRVSQPLEALSPEGCGTRLYQGKPADVWACGVTLYRLLYGVSPFAGSTIGEMYDQLRYEQYIPHRLRYPPSIDPSLRSLLQGMLDKDPKSRLTIHDVASHPWLQ